jgi:hypothetical protein
MSLKQIIDYVQDLVDLHGDTWLAMFTLVMITRIIMAAFRHPPITMAEAAAYASCVTAFAATNIGKPRQ